MIMWEQLKADTMKNVRKGSVRASRLLDEQSQPVGALHNAVTLIMALVMFAALAYVVFSVFYAFAVVAMKLYVLYSLHGQHFTAP